MTADSSTVLSVTRLANPHPWRYAFNHDHLQGKALNAANREGEGETGRARRSASRQSLDPVQRLRHPGCRCKATRLRSTGLLSGKFYAQGKEQLEVRAQGRPQHRPSGAEELREMKTLVDRWIEMATELSTLRLANKHT